MNDTTYTERMDDARQRLRAALAPKTEQQHAIVDWLHKWDLPTLETLALLTEQAIRTRVRAARMQLADHVLHHWQAGSVELVELMMHIASGADELPDRLETADVASSATITNAHQRAIETAAAYDRGWREAVDHCRVQQARGLDPELWAAKLRTRVRNLDRERE